LTFFLGVRSNQNWNRDYDPLIGRYIESDPIGLAGGSLSTYQYCNANPLTRVDPNAEAFVDCAEALADLVRATANVELRLAEMVACGKHPDAGHIKALQQAVNRLQKAYDKVNDHCGDYVGAAAALALALLVLAEAAAVIAAAAVV
jgi:uncharacterized protein RhaS with RHS repeats